MAEKLDLDALVQLIGTLSVGRQNRERMMSMIARIRELEGASQPGVDRCEKCGGAKVSQNPLMTGACECQVECRCCNGSGWIVRDPDIGTDQECPVCDGSGHIKEASQPGGGEADNCGHCNMCAPITMQNMRMIICEQCGNKRCPHANDHRNACTGSNEPGQLGSAYPRAATGAGNGEGE